jgi:hypothetical protein
MLEMVRFYIHQRENGHEGFGGSRGFGPFGYGFGPFHGGGGFGPFEGFWHGFWHNK